MSAGYHWTAIGAGLIAFAVLAPSVPSGQKSPPAPDRQAGRPGVSRPSAAGPPAAPLVAGLASRELERAPDGHFYAEAQVNGARIRFLVDTGASIVALTPQDAQRAGIALPSERALARGVGGTVEIIPVTIDRLAIGSLEARNVRAAVAEELPISLLGQSFLSQVARVEISGDRMVLR